MKRVLITGGAGFIAHHLIYHILKTTNWEIVSLDRLDYSGNLNRLDNVLSSLNENDKARVQVVFHDLKSELNPWIRKDIGEVNIILHLAAGSHVDRSIEFPIEFVMDNVLGTANILEYVRNSNYVKSLIYVTSDKVYENSELNRIFKENDKLGGADPYSSSKAAAECLFTAYYNSYFKNKSRLT